ncbi:hypothetical protein DPMN_059744 [Dreissena polymorpha]|uniref:Uncharacterized protein n=1 Tax=Dreissena polymorpha TaxID=45954 RepID=A0A9D4HHI8_DREPO|nr:hypothetical protein DPMN_059744 [Dreissena polymorpha]
MFTFQYKIHFSEIFAFPPVLPDDNRDAFVADRDSEEWNEEHEQECEPNIKLKLH